MIRHCLGVTGGLSMFDRGSRIVRDEGPKALLLGVVDEMRELLVDHHQLVAEGAQACAGLAQLLLDGTFPHGSIVSTGFGMLFRKI